MDAALTTPNLALTEDQAILARTASAFAAERLPLSRLRKLREADGVGYSREIWSEMAKLGWTGIPFAESDGGAGLGLAEVVVVTEALGRCLAPEPFVASVMLAGQALAIAGTPSQRGDALGPLVSGDKIVALALHEQGMRYEFHRVTTRATKSSGAAYSLRGTKSQVAAAFGADAIVVPARTSGGDGDTDGITLFLVPAAAPGLSITRQHLIDSRNAARLELAGVEVSEAALLGPVGGGAAILDTVIDRATVALCGEMLGGMSEAFGRTLAYLKERTQFGVPIGSFQALKHRAARMFVEIELARSAVMAAARALDDGLTMGRALVSVAKARCSDAYVHIANEAVQMHGGIGMTDEHDIGLFMKHARVAEITFGDGAFHRNRFASLQGF
jgi:alkylation response protein AidB-like acyl-CoA dehydrogenase